MNLPRLPDFSALTKRQWAILGGGAAVLAAVLIAVGVAVTRPAQPDTTPPATAETATSEMAATPAPTAASTQAAKVGTVLPETADAGRSYLDETLFIGDSNTARYTMYADESGKAFTTLDNNIGVVSMGVDAITTLQCEKFKGSSTTHTVPDSVAMLKPKRIIICYGTNNLGGSSTDATKYIASYLKGIQAIQTAWPYADIIVSAIPPLDYQRENTNLTMTQVDADNAALITMCEENGYKFLNSAEVLRDGATGWAKKDYTLSDGVHLSQTAVTAYFQYVRTHAYIAEDRRPQPLGDIPQPDGVPANLITKDPIAVRGAKVPLEFVAESGGTLSGTTSQLVKKGATSAAVTAVPNEGYTFAGWTASCGGSYSSASIAFTMPQNADAGGVVLTAHFTAAEHEHNYVESDDGRVAPTCETAGSAKYICSICDDTIEKEIPALGHDWNEGEQRDGQIVYTCRREGCGATRSEASAHQHTYDGGVITQEPTCTSSGVRIYTCTGCGEQVQEELSPLPHTPGNAQLEGSDLVTRCTVCNAELARVAAPVETPPPTAAPTEVPPTAAPTDAPTQAPTEVPAAETPVPEAPAPEETSTE